MDFLHHVDSPLGGITLASDGEALIGCWFDGQRFFARTLEADRAEAALPVFDRAERWLETYFSGRAPDFTPPLRPRGTPFQRAVWEVLLTIPWGCTLSYGEIGARLPVPCASARAVGGAVGRNPVSLIIPCHRAVGADGRLTGYAGGLERKAALLGLERNKSVTKFSQVLDRWR